MRRPLVACFALLALPAVARAQREPESIPRVLVESAMGFYSGTDMMPHFTVGRAPVEWPAALLPTRPATILGGSATGPMSGIVVETPRRGAPFAAFAPMLERAGYHMVDSSRLAAVGGFAGTPHPGQFGVGELWCASPASVVMLRVLDSTATKRRLVVSRIMGSTSLCAPAPSVGESIMAGDHLPLRVPLLVAPAGAMVSDQGSSSSGSSFDVHATADDALTATALAEHYAAELGRAGWTLLGGTVGTDRTAVRSLRVTDKNGATWEGALVIVTAGTRRRMDIYMSERDAQ